MTFEINGLPGKALSVSLDDIVRAITSRYSSLQWSIVEFCGRGRMDASYPGDRTYKEFREYLNAQEVTISSADLARIALATADIDDVLLIGFRDGSVPRHYDGSDPWKRFWTFAEENVVVAECVDSGFWRVSIRDDVPAREIAQSIGALPGAVVKPLKR